MQCLVSGVSSGLGEYLAGHLRADRYDRAAGSAPQARYDAIIHCAFDASREVPAEKETEYTHNTLGITQQLLAVPHARFVFISSCDVYPTSGAAHREDETLSAESLPDRYGKSKLAAEKLVFSQAKNPLILRPTAMLGPAIRKNSLLKILSGEHPKLTLSAKSAFNYVLHDDIAGFIGLCLKNSAGGIFNIASRDNVTLESICTAFGKTAEFGEYRYDTGTIDNAKAAALWPAFARSSLETVRHFIAG
jgi:nucleoside-diphosphate-sugar epimerase